MTVLNNYVSITLCLCVGMKALFTFYPYMYGKYTGTCTILCHHTYNQITVALS